MHLVFVHGWAFNSAFWDLTAKELSDYSQQHVDLGFFGNPVSLGTVPEDSVLIGHSLGFVHGMKQIFRWKAWIAINSFPRFVDQPGQLGCVSAVVLRNLRVRLAKDQPKALAGFYAMSGGKAASGIPDRDRLRWGLDELHESDITTHLVSEQQCGLVLAARQDPLVPAAVSNALAGDGEIVWHESKSHVLPQSDPHFCASHIRDFLERHGRAL